MGYGTILKAILKEKKISIKQLSENTGISLNTLYSITKRDNDTVDISILSKIAKYLNIDISELLDSNSSRYKDYLESIKEYTIKQEVLTRIFAMNLNYLLGYHNLSLDNLSKYLNISSETIDKWINGEQLPTTHEMSLLEDMLNVQHGDLMDKVIIGKFDNKPTEREINHQLNESFNRLSKEDKEKINEYIEFLENKKRS